MFERFTDRARHVVVRAQDEARGLNHNYIGAEHLLLAILLEDDATVAQVLITAGLTPERVKECIIEMVGQGTEAPNGHIPFAPSTKFALHNASLEANKMNDPHIRVAHLALGILRDAIGYVGDTMVGRILTDLGLTVDVLQKDLVLVAVGVPISLKPEQDSSPKPSIGVFPGHWRGGDGVATLALVAPTGHTLVAVKVLVRNPDGTEVWLERTVM